MAAALTTALIAVSASSSAAMTSATIPASASTMSAAPESAAVSHGCVD